MKYLLKLPLLFDCIVGCQIRNITLKVLTGDILQQNTQGIVNSVTEDFKFLGNILLKCNVLFIIILHTLSENIILKRASRMS